MPDLEYKESFFPGATYNPRVPTPASILGFPVGSKPATHAQIEAVLKATAAASPRCKLIDLGRWLGEKHAVPHMPGRDDEDSDDVAPRAHDEVEDE